MVIAFGSFPIDAVVGSPFCFFCVFSFSYLHAVHLGSSQGRHYTAKGNRARPPGGCREVVLCGLTSQ